VLVLIYLASQTFLEGDGDEDIAYSELKTLVRNQPDSIQEVVFEPESFGIEVRLRNGNQRDAHYPSDESQIAFEQLLDEQGVAYDSKGRGSSGWWPILTYVLPFVIFFGFWIFLMQRGQEKPLIRRRTEAE
jgi:cell division protease FtsH